MSKYRFNKILTERQLILQVVCVARHFDILSTSSVQLSIQEMTFLSNKKWNLKFEISFMILSLLYKSISRD